MDKITTASEFGNWETCVKDELRKLWYRQANGAYKELTFLDWQTEELFRLLGGIIPQKVEAGCTAEPEPTTDLDFWQAYQAMRRGEWVSGEEFAIVNAHLELDADGKSVVVVFSDERCDFILNYDDLLSTSWYIVPKGPRYKVGDRFEREAPGDIHPTGTMETSEIMYAELTPLGAQYATKIWIGETKHYRGMVICGDCYFDKAKKLS